MVLQWQVSEDLTEQFPSLMFFINSDDWFEIDWSLVLVEFND